MGRLRRKGLTHKSNKESPKQECSPRYASFNQVRCLPKGSFKMRKTRTDLDLTKYTSQKEILPPRLEKQIYALAEASGKVKKMTVDLDTHQKCVTNLAATVVRQNEQIKDLRKQVLELVSMLESPDRTSCCADSAMDVRSQTPTSTSSLESESSDQNERDAEHAIALNAVIDSAKELNLMLDEVQGMIEQNRERSQRPARVAQYRRHRRSGSHSGDFSAI